MIDVDKHVAYWRDGAKEDWDVAAHLVNSGHVRHGLFFLHLAFEKALKAHMCKATQDVPPRIHDLVKLAKRSGLTLPSDAMDLLGEVNEFNLIGRYPKMLPTSPGVEYAQGYIQRSEETFQWLMTQL